jgi:hypothetical protein
MVAMSSSCFNYMHVNWSEGNLLMDEPMYQRLRPSSEMLVVKKKVFRFIMGPIAKIRAIRDTALPAFAKSFYICNNFIFEFVFLLRDKPLLAGDHEVTGSQ